MATQRSSKSISSEILITCLVQILAIILPPLGVFLETGCSGDLLLNIILTCLGYIPGILHALYVPGLLMPLSVGVSTTLTTPLHRYIIFKY
jgi:uncharacterized membrane protein YqaE (UPF0057 family)